MNAPQLLAGFSLLPVFIRYCDYFEKLIIPVILMDIRHIMSSPGQRRGNCGHVKASFDSHTHCAHCRDKGKVRTFVLRTMILLIARFVTPSPLSNVNNWPLHHIKLRKKNRRLDTET